MLRINCLFLLNFIYFLKVIITNKFIIFISDLGFLFYRILNLKIIIFNFNFYIFFYNVKYKSTINKLFLNAFYNVLFGCIKVIYIVGIGFRLWVDNSNIFLRLGYANIFSLHLPNYIYFLLISKLRFSLFSFDLFKLNKYCFYLRSLKKNNKYKQRGLYFNNEILSFRVIRNKKIY